MAILKFNMSNVYATYKILIYKYYTIMKKTFCNIMHITGNKKTNKTCKIDQQFQTLYSTYLHIVTITNNTLKSG